jgi:hypothetical protein
LTQNPEVKPDEVRVFAAVEVSEGTMRRAEIPMKGIQ